jgi:putative AdoMet-dependent methyltransferase
MSSLFGMDASQYDQIVQESDRLNQFPFAGYDEVLTQIADMIRSAKHLSVAEILDLGIGTGQLYQKLSPDKYSLFGIDNSEEMLEIAKLKLPGARLMAHDFLKGMPEGLKKRKFDFIVATYAFHHVNISDFVKLIDYYLGYLSPFGKLLIGDILFTDASSREQVHEENLEFWDESEYYHAFSELIELLDGRLALSFLKISFCAGIIVIENYHETTLHFEETLVQYKSNTVKWKSNQTGKKASGR